MVDFFCDGRFTSTREKNEKASIMKFFLLNIKQILKIKILESYFRLFLNL